MKKILRYELHNTIRNKWILIYTFFFFFIGYALFAFSGESSKAYISLMNIVLIIIPIVSLVFGAIYLYNSREFIEMMLGQPIDRKSLFYGIYLGTSLPLLFAWVIGILIPYFLFSNNVEHAEGLIIVILLGSILTLIFTAISFFIALRQDDKSKGLAYSIFIWLVLAILWDGLILLIIYSFEEYPLDKLIIGISIINPIDLGRILFLLKFNISALMGYTGAVFQKFFGESFGLFVSLVCLIAWFIIPLILSSKYFNKKDF